MTIQNIAFSSNSQKIMNNKTQKDVSFSGDPGSGIGNGLNDLELDEYADYLRATLKKQQAKEAKEKEVTGKKLDIQG